jgi:hypothetical protein
MNTFRNLNKPKRYLKTKREEVKAEQKQPNTFLQIFFTVLIVGQACGTDITAKDIFAVSMPNTEI